MRAKLMPRDKAVHDDDWIVWVVIWQVSTPVLPSEHGFKYRFHAGKNGQRVCGFNKQGKGDHKHSLKGEAKARLRRIAVAPLGNGVWTEQGGGRQRVLNDAMILVGERR